MDISLKIQTDKVNHRMTINLPLCGFCHGHRIIESDAGSPGENFAICNGCNGHGYPTRIPIDLGMDRSLRAALFSGKYEVKMVKPKLPKNEFPSDAKVYPMCDHGSREPDTAKPYVTYEKFLRGGRPGSRKRKKEEALIA